MTLWSQCVAKITLPVPQCQGGIDVFRTSQLFALRHQLPDVTEYLDRSECFCYFLELLDLIFS